MQNDPKLQNDLSKVREKISEIEEKSADGEYIYRGESEHYKDPPYCGRVSSNLWRELDAVKAKYSDIKEVQAAIVADAKEREDNKTDDFEILTALQHYGGKTNLIDFTTDYNVAIFFACYGSPGEDGRVIILQKTEEAKKMLRYPQEPEKRIRAQKSVFVEPPMGYIEQKYKVICIPKDLKLLMLQYLRENLPHEISPKTIYNDIHGFIRSHNDNWLAYRDFDDGLASQNKADKAKSLKEKRKAYEEAIKHYTNALDRNLHLPTVYNNRGNAYSDIGEFEYAIEDYNMVIQLKPDDAVAYYNRGMAYGVKCKYDYAIKDFDMAIQLKPDLTVAYYNRGVAYKNKRENELAIADFTRAIELNSDYAEAYNHRGVVYGDKGNYDRAIEEITEAIKLDPDYTEAYTNRAVAYNNKRENELAIADFTKAIELNPDYANAYYDRGVAYGLKGNPDSAFKDFNTAIELNPDHANAYNNRGVFHNSKRKNDLAIKDFTKAIELQPNFAKAYSNRGMAWLYLGVWDKAKSDLKTARNMGADIITSFHNGYESVPDFNQKHGVQIPDDIAEMLTPQ